MRGSAKCHSGAGPSRPHLKAEGNGVLRHLSRRIDQRVCIEQLAPCVGGRAINGVRLRAADHCLQPHSVKDELKWTDVRRHPFFGELRELELRELVTVSVMRI